MNTIQASWENFQKIVIPTDASDTQVNEMKKSFYAGAMSLMRIQIDLLEDPDISEDAIIAITEGIEEELQMFAAMVKSGKIT